MQRGEARARGDRIGPFVLGRRLGAGGHGEVWEAVLEGPAGFRKPVALKLLRDGPADAGTRERLVREARLGALIQHPNVVATLQLGDHGGCWCVALELVRGLTVDALREHAGGRLPAQAVIDIGVQAAAGLAHLHTFRADGVAGLVHRDVKPSNLLVDRTGLVKLADLGISLPRGESVEVAGTAGYVAPEQLAGAPEPRSDLFSLAATLYVLATGRRPFGRGREALRAVRHVEDLLRSDDFLQGIEAAVPGLGPVLKGCLRYDPRLRPSTAHELGDALAALRHRQAPGPTLLELLARAAPDLDLHLSRTPSSQALTREVPLGNLRVPRDPFVGREPELEDVRRLVRSERWVVLVGPGGIGKTRLALEVARSTRHERSGGAWAFDLTEARNGADVCAAVASGLGLELERRDPEAHLGRVFAAKGDALVVLDNLEGCLDALPGTVGRWLELASTCSFLGTSRVVPGLVGEQQVELRELSPADAVALFFARAPRVLAAAERAEVEPLCEALERVPLAIELAVARLRILDLHAIRSRLSLDLLAGGDRSRPERHRSIAASFAWSCRLLSRSGLAALARASVFEGPFDLAAAEAVLDLPESPWVLDTLQELSDASLLQVDTGRDRFRSHLLVREFARGLLAPTERAAVEARHGARYAQLGSPEAIHALSRAGGTERYAELASDLDNVVAACRRAVRRGDPAVAVAALSAANAVLERRGPATLRGELAALVLTVPGLCGSDRARALRCRAATLGGDDARRHLDLALAACREAGDRRFEGAVLASQGHLLVDLGRPVEARATYELALAAFEETGATGPARNVVGDIGNVDLMEGRCEDARRRLEHALTGARRDEDARSTTTWSINLGGLHFHLGEMAPARALYGQALTASMAAGDRHGEAFAHSCLAALIGLDRGPDAAIPHFDRALALLDELGNPLARAELTLNRAELQLEAGRLDEASEGIGAALEVHRALRAGHEEGRALFVLADLRAAQGSRDTAAVLYEQAIQRFVATGQRVLEAAAVMSLGVLRSEQGRTREARDLLARSVALADEVESRVHAGSGLVELARILAVTEGVEAASLRLDRAETALRAGPSRNELAILLALRAELAHRAGAPDAARAILREAVDLGPWSVRAVREVDRVRGLVA